MVVAILNQKSAVGRLPSHRIWARALHIEGAEVLVVAPTRKARPVTGTPLARETGQRRRLGRPTLD